MLQLFHSVKHRTHRAGYNLYNLSLKCNRFAFECFLFLHSSRAQDILPPPPQTNPLFSALSYEIVWKRAKLSLCLMTLSDKLAAGIQTPMRPLVRHSWAARRHAPPGGQGVQQLDGLESWQVFVQRFYSYIAPLIIYSGFIAIPLPSWSCGSPLCCEGSIKWEINK